MCRKILITLVGVALATALVSAQTTVPGGDVSGSWTVTGSPYLIEGEITVPVGETLNIEPGVEVNFQGHYKLIVNGYLEAVGVEGDSILFTADNTTEGWHGIRFVDAQDYSHLSYCIVQYGHATGSFPDNVGGGVTCSGSSPVISNCLIRWNSAELLAGGIASMFGSNPTLSYCTISENSAGYMNGGMGGGWVSSPVLSYCTISGNSADYMGGGFGGGEDYDPILDNCVISGNSTYSSGGGINLGSVVNPTITNCTIINNTSIIRGGGIAVGNNCGGLIENCTITGNTADSIGGGVVFGDDYTGLIDNCTITDNSAGFNGGGIHCFGNVDDATISNCTISGNTAGNHGGGIACIDDANPTIEYCTLSSNEADSCGGGIASVGSDPIISHCTISGNDAGVYGGGTVSIYGSSPTISYCDITENTAFIHGGCGGGWENASPTYLRCNISDNTATYIGGGMGHGEDASPTISYCVISGNTAVLNDVGGVGFYYDCHGSMDNCIITGNSAGAEYGGIAIAYVADPIITNCVITGNTASTDYGGIGIHEASPTIRNCTISENSAGGNGGGIGIDDGEPTILNTIVEGNSGNGGIYFNDAANSSVTYCDFYDNEGGDFTGSSIPVGLGVITSTNYNGDPCDDFSNILLDPMFVDAENGFFQLMVSSPCVDGGDPNSPYDPNGTIADIGAYPLNCPCGKGFWKNQARANLTGRGHPYYSTEDLLGFSQDIFDRFYGNTIQVDGVTYVGAPASSLTLDDIYNTLTGRTSMHDLACQHFLALLLNVVSDRLSQFSMASEDGATVAQAIVYIDEILGSEDELAKDIAMTLNDGGVVEEGVIPLDTPILIFSDGLEAVLIPNTFKFSQPFPNPFNATAVMQFTLPEALEVNLVVYDISGRKVMTLIDGWRDEGNHQVTFDGSMVASGVYFYRIEAGEFSGIGKMVLMK